MYLSVNISVPYADHIGTRLRARVRGTSPRITLVMPYHTYMFNLFLRSYYTYAFRARTHEQIRVPAHEVQHETRPRVCFLLPQQQLARAHYNPEWSPCAQPLRRFIPIRGSPAAVLVNAERTEADQESDQQGYACK